MKGWLCTNGGVDCVVCRPKILSSLKIVIRHLYESESVEMH